jgi:manganese/zinc/iron transport system substrate-binding protein
MKGQILPFGPVILWGMKLSARFFFRETGRLARWGWLGLLGWGLAACAPPAREAAPPGQKPYLVCTTGLVADAVRALVGNLAQVDALMGPGVDPHLYKASLGDVRKLAQANVLIYNGLHLEGKLESVLKKVARQKPVLALADQVPPARLRWAGGATRPLTGAPDPHLWFDVALWRQGVAGLAQQLAPQFAPAQQAQLKAQTTAYLAQLDSLHARTHARLAQVPAARRILITSHDAFGYFGRAYQCQVIGLQGFSTLADFGLRDITALVDLIVSRGVKVIFAETSVSAKAIEAVVSGCQARGHSVTIGGALYSDALGQPGTPAGTYLGMVEANVTTLLEAWGTGN